MALLNRIFLSFLPTAHRLKALRETPETPWWPEWVAMGVFLLLTSWLWPVAGIVEAAVRLTPAAAVGELRYFAIDMILRDLLPLGFFLGVWFAVGRGFNLNQKFRLAFMTWLPAILIRAIMQGIPLLSPKVAYLPMPVLDLPQLVALAEALVNLSLLLMFLRVPAPGDLRLPGFVAPAFAGSQVLLAAVFFWYPLTMAVPRFIVAPDFTTPALDGGTCSLSAHRGKPVLVEFWSLGCPHCRHMIPELDQLARRMGDDLVILSVHVSGGAGAAPQLRPHFPEPHHPVCLDDGTASKLYKALKKPHRPMGVPHMVLIDRNGIIRRSLSGRRDASLLESEIRASGILR
jgi:thiol-disulfide isomerase/thioredoxin